MKRQIGIFLLLCSLIYLCGCTPEYGIIRSYAFHRDQVRGTIASDPENRSPDRGVEKTHLLFLETAKDKPLPEWTVAWVEGRPYSVRAVEIKEPLRLGRLKENQEEMVLKKKEKRRIWQLVLFPHAAIQPDPAISEFIRQNAVVLTGTWSGGPARYTIKREKELETVFMQ